MTRLILLGFLQGLERGQQCTTLYFPSRLGWLDYVRRHRQLCETPMQLAIREASANDAPHAKACVVSAFEHYTERLGKPPAPMLLDFSAEIEAKHVWLAES